MHVSRFLAGLSVLLTLYCFIASPRVAAASGIRSSRAGIVTLMPVRMRCTNGKARVDLSWQGSGTSSFIIERRQSTERTWSLLATTPSSHKTYADRTVTAGKYLYRISTRVKRLLVSSNEQGIIADSCVASRSSSSSSAVPSLRPKSSASSSSASMSGKVWGAAVGWKPEDGPAFEKLVGKPMMNRAVFVHWGNESEFPVELKDTLRGKMLTIFWEAMDYTVDGSDQPKFSYSAILRGDWDAYLRSFAADAKDYGGSVILIPFEEMNGDWYAWSVTQNGNTPAQHIAAYRYIREFFRDAPNVKFGWAVNHDSTPETRLNRYETYYPGDAYVDVVGVDGFNFGSPWQTFDQVFTNALMRLSTFKKLLYIFSTASAEGPKKAAWITDAFVVQVKKHPEITGWIWFNEDKEKDWRVDSDEASLEAFKKALP